MLQFFECLLKEKFFKYNSIELTYIAILFATPKINYDIKFELVLWNMVQ